MGWIPGKTKVDIVYMELWVTSTGQTAQWKARSSSMPGAQPKMTSTQLELDASVIPTALNGKPAAHLSGYPLAAVY